MRCAIRANFLETFIIFYHSGWNSPTRPSNPSHTGTSDLQEIEIRVEFTPDRFVCLCQTFQINEHSIFRLLTQSLRCGDFEIAQILDRFDSRFSANYVPPPREGSLVFFALTRAILSRPNNRSFLSRLCFRPRSGNRYNLRALLLRP